MRKMMWIAAVAAVALSAAGVAVAELQQGGSASLATATFSARSVDVRTSLACGNVQVTNAVYAGRSTGDSVLAGPVRVSVRAAIDAATRLGTVDGFLTAGATRAHLTAVYRDGKLSGFVAGVAGGQRVVGTLTADYSPETGFSAGAIGNGAVGAFALRASEGVCKPRKSESGQKG